MLVMRSGGGGGGSEKAEKRGTSRTKWEESQITQALLRQMNIWINKAGRRTMGPSRSVLLEMQLSGATQRIVTKTKCVIVSAVALKTTQALPSKSSAAVQFMWNRWRHSRKKETHVYKDLL